MTGRCCERGQLEVRERTRSVAAIDFLGDPQAAQFAPQIDCYDALAALLECVPGIVVAVANFIERVADTIVVAELRFLACLEAQGIRLVDLALGLQAGWQGQRRGGQGEAGQEAGQGAGEAAKKSSRTGTHGYTHARVAGQAERALPGFRGSA